MSHHPSGLQHALTLSRGHSMRPREDGEEMQQYVLSMQATILNALRTRSLKGTMRFCFLDTLGFTAGIGQDAELQSCRAG